MGFTLAQQGACLLASVLFGLFLGVLYEVFRLFRIVFPSSKGVFIFDFLYMIFFSFSSLFLSMAYSDGSVRYFSVMGEICGILLIRFAIGRYTPRVFPKVLIFSRKIIKIVTEFIAKNAKKLLQPIVYILYNKGRKKRSQSN